MTSNEATRGPRHWFRVGAVCLAATLGAAAQGPGGPMTALRVGSVYQDGAVTPGPLTILIQDGRIVALGAEVTVPATATRVDHPGALAFPGFVDAAAGLGVDKARSAPARPYVPDLAVADGLDAGDPRFPTHVAAGVTSFHGIPGASEPVGGRSAVFGWRSGVARFLGRNVTLGISLDEEAYASDRAPTSTLGLLQDLPDLLASASFAEVRGRQRPVFLRAADGAQVDLALELTQRHRLRTILGADLSALEDRVGRIAAAGLEGVVVRTFAPATPEFERRRLGDLAQAGVRFAFGSDGGLDGPHGLRLAAMAAARAGVPETALERALTIDAAAMLGLAERIGSLAVGREADILILSGHPLDPRSRMLAVLQDGHPVPMETRR